MACGNLPSHLEQRLRSCFRFMQCLQRPETLFGFAAWPHSESVNSQRTFISLHSLHLRFSWQLLHHKSDGSRLRQALGSNRSSGCQLPHHLHCFFKPLWEHSLSQLLQSLLPSLRFHCGSENSALKALVLQPWHMVEGMCFCSTAAQSTWTPRKTFNRRFGPSRSPWVNKARSKGLNIKRSSIFFTLVKAT